LQYTNRGLGMVGVQIRINCRPEITIFNLQSG
jgi:predicted MPP superfamily phosphohydrolase